jgi:hypothetical protein
MEAGMENCLGLFLMQGTKEATEIVVLTLQTQFPVNNEMKKLSTDMRAMVAYDFAPLKAGVAVADAPVTCLNMGSRIPALNMAQLGITS